MNRNARGTVALLVAVLAALAVTACGSSGSGGNAASKNAASTTTTGKRASAAQAAFTACLKQHGVKLSGRAGGFGFGPGAAANGKRPNGNGTPPTGATPSTGTTPQGGLFGGGAGFGARNSKFAKAFAACRSKLGKAGFGRGGFPGASGRGRFPGPNGGNGAPGANGASGANGGGFTPRFSSRALKAYVACIRRNGYPSMPEPDTSSKATSVFPSSVTKNAKFQAANGKCESILRRAFRGPGASGGSGATTTSTTSGA